MRWEVLRGIGVGYSNGFLRGSVNSIAGSRGGKKREKGGNRMAGCISSPRLWRGERFPSSSSASSSRSRCHLAWPLCHPSPSRPRPLRWSQVPESEVDQRREWAFLRRWSGDGGRWMEHKGARQDRDGGAVVVVAARNWWRYGLGFLWSWNTVATLRLVVLLGISIRWMRELGCWLWTLSSSSGLYCFLRKDRWIETFL